MNIQALEVRQQLFEFIQKFPGLHFREIQRRTSLPVGSLQYHLKQLENEKLVVCVKDGEYARFYPVEAVTGTDRAILPFLRQTPIRRMLVFLIGKGKANHKALTEVSGVSPATTSWYLNKIADAGIVSRKKQGREVFYSVVNPKEVTRTIVSYRTSFLDRVVERFADLLEK